MIVRVQELSRSFGDVPAVDRLSLEVRRGEMFGRIGPDGAGKTTTLRMVLGILAPDSGSVETTGPPKFLGNLNCLFVLVLRPRWDRCFWP